MEKRIYYVDIILQLSDFLWSNNSSGVGKSENQDMGRIIIFGTTIIKIGLIRLSCGNWNIFGSRNAICFSLITKCYEFFFDHEMLRVFL